MPLLTQYYFFFDEDFFLGTLPPAFRASDSPIAIACFLLFTFLPEPLLSVPFFRSCIAFSTFLDAFLPYLAIVCFPPSNYRGLRNQPAADSDPRLAASHLSGFLMKPVLLRYT